ncbi:tubulin beta chain [Flagelloscypha sp. PMI_526]|nr:tubulin beta chain [Flagelloscypha sp. PMI_526]
MREIISLQVGRSGNAIGCKFWESISAEHDLEHTGTYTGQNNIQLEHIDVYFNELKSCKYVPRAVAVDLEPWTRDYVLQSSIGRMFRPDNVVVGQGGGGNNWARGHYTDGAELANPIIDIVRREAEKSESLEGFQMTHCPGGATGGGLASLLLSRLREEYPSSMVSTFTVTPAPHSDTIVEPYNFILSSNHLIENCDACFLIDNEALYGLAYRKFKLNTSSYPYPDFNSVISQVMAGITAFLRFPSQNSLNSDLRRLSGNMVPFPRLHFLETGSAPLIAGVVKHGVVTLPELSTSIFHPNSSMSAYKTMEPEEQYLSLSILLRGNVPFEEAQTQIHQARLASPHHRLTDSIPEETQVSQCPIAPNRPNRLNMSAALLGNTTAIRGTFKHFNDGFNAMYRRKAFLHWYTGEGMDEMEFAEAESNVSDLIVEYQEMLDDTTYEAEEE